MRSIIILLLASVQAIAQKYESLPVRGFCIEAPRPADLDRFLGFIEKELAPRHVNTLILRVDFAYQYTSHPELRDSISLSPADVKRIVAACKQHQIRLIPQINLLGHQSWASRVHNLLRVYPQFDETPHVTMPEKYAWPNADGLYCKSYCPLHPEVHKVVFDLVDEICNVFESTAFHAGLDEVFYIADDKCPRCSGRDPAEIFAGEVRTIRDHLAISDRELWMWGDRLLDGKTTGLGMWEASMNNTHRAVDLVPHDVMICDWHYERVDQTAVYFATKGFRVATCPWRNRAVAVEQLIDMIDFRASGTREVRERYQGMIQTVWSPAARFLDGFYNSKKEQPDEKTEWNCFRGMFEVMNGK